MNTSISHHPQPLRHGESPEGSPPGSQGNGLGALGLLEHLGASPQLQLLKQKRKGRRSFYLMQMTHQIPTLQLAADKTVGSPASTEE